MKNLSLKEERKRGVIKVLLTGLWGFFAYLDPDHYNLLQGEYCLVRSIPAISLFLTHTHTQPLSHSHVQDFEPDSRVILNHYNGLQGEHCLVRSIPAISARLGPGLLKTRFFMVFI